MDTNFSLYQSEDPDSSSYHRKRKYFRIAVTIFIVILILIIGKIVYLQNFGDYKSNAEAISVRWHDVVPMRGTIYSDSHQALAVDILRYSLAIDPDATALKRPKDSAFFMEHADELALALSTVIGERSRKEYYDTLTGLVSRFAKGNHMLSDHWITAGELDRLKDASALMKIDRNKSGIIVKEHYRREYPNGNIAKRTIGLKNDISAYSGLEKSLDDKLAGKKGTQKMVRITQNIWRPQYDINNVNPIYGLDVVTTIDIKLQEFVQNALCQQVEEMKAEWGTAIVLDVKTGDIKAVANVTNNKAQNKILLEQYNGEFYAIHRRLEPGSTFKTVALMCMLDDKNMPMSEKYNTGNGGPVTFSKDAVITDDHAAGIVNVQQILEQSSNIGMAMIANKYYHSDPERLIERIEKTGIYETLNLDIPTTIHPVHYRKGNKFWSYGGFLKMTYGYTVDMTPMHIAMFYNGIANNGVMLNPRFVTRYEDSRKHIVVEEIPVKVVNPKLCSDETLAKIKKSLEGVVANGTGHKTVGPAKYKCAGKTGTARLSYQKGGYEGNDIKYYASFVGYFPCDAPRYTVLVGIETHMKYKREKQYSGAMVSAPVFTKIVDYIYDRDHADNVTKEKYVSTVSSPISSAYGDGEKLDVVASQLGLKVGIPSDESLVYGIDSTGIVSRKMIKDSISMSDLNGMALSDALSLLHDAGYTVGVVGEGHVHNAAKSGNKITLYLR